MEYHDKSELVADEQAYVNLTEQVYEQLTDLFIRGELRPGDVITERRMAERLKASRTPIREALGRLEVEGLVYKVPNRGVIVKPFSTEIFFDMLDTRRLLEGETAYLAAGRMPKTRIDEIRSRLAALKHRSQPTQIEIWSMDQFMHGEIAEAAGNVIMAQMIRDLRRRIHVFNAYRNTFRAEYDFEENERLLDAIESGDGDRARAAMVQHIDHVKRATLERLSGTRR